MWPSIPRLLSAALATLSLSLSTFNVEHKAERFALVPVVDGDTVGLYLSVPELEVGAGVHLTSSVLATSLWGSRGEAE